MLPIGDSTLVRSLKVFFALALMSAQSCFRRCTEVSIRPLNTATAPEKLQIENRS